MLLTTRAFWLLDYCCPDAILATSYNDETSEYHFIFNSLSFFFKFNWCPLIPDHFSSVLYWVSTGRQTEGAGLLAPPRRGCRWRWCEMLRGRAQCLQPRLVCVGATERRLLLLQKWGSPEWFSRSRYVWPRLPLPVLSWRRAWAKNAHVRNQRAMEARTLPKWQGN